MRKVIKASVVKKPWYINLDKVVDQDQSQALFLYTNALSVSVNLGNVVQIDKNFVEVLDLTARRYGCRPSDIMLPNSNHIEKAVYDFTVCNIGTQKDLATLKKQNAKLNQRKSNG